VERREEFRLPPYRPDTQGHQAAILARLPGILDSDFRPRRLQTPLTVSRSGNNPANRWNMVKRATLPDIRNHGYNPADCTNK
jgi:hypothetical protein